MRRHLKSTSTPIRSNNTLFFVNTNPPQLLMGWLWDSNSQKDASASTDPFRDLDPSLRDFLEKESPVKYKPATSPPSPSTSPAQAVTAASETSPPSPAVPSASLYPDGRYAHLWKTYKPLSEVENATKTDQERLLDILHGYKERKAHIARTALENCSLEQLEVNDCFNGGGLKARMTMCRAENRKFERCYLSQTVSVGCERVERRHSDSGSGSLGREIWNHREGGLIDERAEISPRTWLPLSVRPPT